MSRIATHRPVASLTFRRTQRPVAGLDQTTVMHPGSKRNPHVIRLGDVNDPAGRSGLSETRAAELPELRTGDHVIFPGHSELTGYWTIATWLVNVEGVHLAVRSDAAPHDERTVFVPVAPVRSSPASNGGEPKGQRAGLRFREVARCEACEADIPAERIILHPSNAHARIAGCPACEAVYLVTDSEAGRSVTVAEHGSEAEAIYRGEINRLRRVIYTDRDARDLAHRAQTASGPMTGERFDCVA